MKNRRDFLRLGTHATAALYVAAKAPGEFFFFTKDVIGRQQEELNLQRFIGHWDVFSVTELSRSSDPDDLSLKHPKFAFRQAMEKNDSAELRNITYSRPFDPVRKMFVHTWKAEIRIENREIKTFTKG